MKPMIGCILLTKGFWSFVSVDRFYELTKFKWCASRESRDTKWYAIRRASAKEVKDMGFRAGRFVKIRMHRKIKGLPPLPKDDIIVDHDDDDGLNNVDENLIIRTQAENMDKVPSWKRREEKRREEKRRRMIYLISDYASEMSM